MTRSLIPNLLYVVVVSSVTTCSAVMAEKNAALEPKLTQVGKATVIESFDSPLSKTAAAVKGEWKVVDGTLVAKELAADKHAAVLNYQKPNRNSVVRFSFKIDGSTEGLHFSLNHAKGHLFRVVVTPTGLSINLDKDKKDPASKAKVLATAKGKFEQGQWYTMLVEMVHDKVSVQTDNGLAVEASDPKLDTDKPNYRFVMKGDSLSIDDLEIWELK
ncbi:MAG: DUF1080 domain-containing protein [Planctomycetaceae bacterium]|nr:DUF1080 domain-containing protein [Planctomycetaceae bacterium]